LSVKLDSGPSRGNGGTYAGSSALSDLVTPARRIPNGRGATSAATCCVSPQVRMRGTSANTWVKPLVASCLYERESVETKAAEILGSIAAAYIATFPIRS